MVTTVAEDLLLLPEFHLGILLLSLLLLLLIVVIAVQPEVTDAKLVVQLWNMALFWDAMDTMVKSVTDYDYFLMISLT